ncbi:sigma-54 dependent transcriptional regulator [uncultured Roseibium sp.]|uniref:sigma-54-dependent transcriptional regulator n=1 Tax=uncultured Roseibium sp. TaxID=1936171 RepID=UPI00321793F9
MDQGCVLLIDDEEDLRASLTQGLELSGQTVMATGNPEDALERITRDFYGVLVTDIRMPGEDGFQVMRKAFEIDPALPVVLITGHGDVPLAVEAMRAGAYDFMEKPFSVSSLASVVDRALDKRRLVLENRKLREELADRTGIEGRLVGRAPAMDQLRRTVLALAPTDADVLILGETGAGKEVVARALHDEGPRQSRPFVALNCGALPAEIIESELFGHEKGAFTGASGQRIGKLEHAHGGTVFLDEIESMPLELQVKLLRVIETRTIERLGSNKSIDLDVRFIAATKEDLEAAGREGRFRLDLFYRLNVVTVAIPPLRERLEDIPLLFQHLAVEARARYRREIPDMPDSYLAKLMAHDWPGNVRELRNVADRFVLGLETQASASNSTGASLFDQVAAYEKALIAAELKKNGGVIKETYEGLGLSRKALYEKMRKYGLAKEDMISAE